VNRSNLGVLEGGTRVNVTVCTSEVGDVDVVIHVDCRHDIDDYALTYAVISFLRSLAR